MKKVLLGLVLLFFTLPSCVNQISFYQHYENCMRFYSQMTQIAQCGEGSREQHIAKSGGRGRGNDTRDGDQFAMYVNTLSEMVREGRRSDSEAKLNLLQTISRIRGAREDAIIGILQGAANSNRPGLPSYSGPIHYFQSSYVSGTNRICIYKSGNSEKVLTIGAVQSCPLQY